MHVMESFRTMRDALEEMEKALTMYYQEKKPLTIYSMSIFIYTHICVWKGGQEVPHPSRTGGCSWVAELWSTWATTQRSSVLSACV